MRKLGWDDAKSNGRKVWRPGTAKGPRTKEAPMNRDAATAARAPGGPQGPSIGSLGTVRSLLRSLRKPLVLQGFPGFRDPRDSIPINFWEAQKRSTGSRSARGDTERICTLCKTRSLGPYGPWDASAQACAASSPPGRPAPGER